MIHIRIPLYLILPNTESSCSLIQGCPISYIPYLCHFFTSIVDIGNCLSGLHVRGCLHDTVTTFAPTFAQVHSISLSWLYSCLHDTTTKCHAGASHPGVSSPRFLYRGENFTPVRNLAAVSCKRETTTRFGVKSVCRQTGTGSACVMFAILNHTCILSA